ncbi:unnamed protein product [Cochlearia groenlandica]
MFNAILSESEHQIPTDPVSDPMLDSKILPITSGVLSFGSGARLKNMIGNWSRCLDEMFDINTRDSNLLVDRSIREEVCPSISIELIKRILCNFTPNEFCPDHVPGSVLEELNNESIWEQKLSGGSSFPYAASSLSSVNIANEVSEVRGDNIKLLINVSMIQRKGYTSDEKLEELDSPIASIIEKVSVSLTSTHGEKGKLEGEDTSTLVTNSRYDLLKEVWSMRFDFENQMLSFLDKLLLPYM